MEFNPTDAGDRSGFSLLPEGLYDIEVVEAEERSSKNGNQMIALTLEVRHPDGYPSRVWDYLVSTPAAVFKIKQFCDAAGLTSEFGAGTLTEAHCRNRRLKAKIFVESGRDGYQDRNRDSRVPAHGNALGRHRHHARACHERRRSPADDGRDGRRNSVLSVWGGSAVCDCAESGAT